MGPLQIIIKCSRLTMDMLKKSLSEYFTSLEKHYLVWQKLSTEVERPLNALENQTEQLQLVQRIEWEIPELPHLKERLIYKITAGIENELFTLREMLCGFISSNKDLERQLNKLEQLYHKIECVQHSVTLEMEWAHSSWRYYHTLYPLKVTMESEINSTEALSHCGYRGHCDLDYQQGSSISSHCC
uniref:Uncharacterized protein n=1 Tax=Timema cristinae TaxID=61476 RepID=A0A7R9DGJ2_TIMCR|nr:unnamed protein product [Timema cristinae]